MADSAAGSSVLLIEELDNICRAMSLIFVFRVKASFLTTFVVLDVVVGSFSDNALIAAILDCIGDFGLGGCACPCSGFQFSRERLY